MTAGTVTYAAGMRVALGQLPISPDPAVNLGRVAEALTDAGRRGADLAVFPEATQARFGSDLRAIAEPLDGPFPGLAESELDRALTKQVRAVLPCLENRREDVFGPC